MAPVLTHTTQLVAAIQQLDKGVAAHVAWQNELNRALICGLPPENNTLAPDAHLNCSFGRWFYHRAPEPWQPWIAEIDDIEKQHRNMHDLARTLFAIRPPGTPVAVDTYQAFIGAATHFKHALRSLGFQIMQQVCLIDHLTGARNRNSMYLHLADEHQRMLRTRSPCCLSMMDLDHFKWINDAHGHPAGDEVLQTVTAVVAAKLRRYDTIFRYGGEEFLICLPNSSLDHAETVIERIRANIEATPVTLKSGETLCVTASFGIAELSDSLPCETSVEQADQALLHAKNNGRNRVSRHHD